MELYGYSMDDVIEVSREIMNMFSSGGPVGIEVNLSFNKNTSSGEIPFVTKFTTDETVKFYTQTTVSESYTVDTYVKLTEPNGRTRYAYHNDPNFQPSDPLSFYDTEVRFYPDHWNAVNTNWNWNEYTFSNADAFESKTFRSSNSNEYNILMILATPKNTIVNGQPNIDPWYQNNGDPQWYRDVANDTEDYYWRISYGQAKLNITVSDQWFELQRPNEDYQPRDSNHYADSLDVAQKSFEYSKFEIIIVVDSARPGGNEWTHEGAEHTGASWPDKGRVNEEKITVTTPYERQTGAYIAIVSSISHEITHAINHINPKGRGTIGLNHGDNHGGPAIMGEGMAGMQPFCPLDAWKMGFSSFSEISSAWNMPHERETVYGKLDPIEKGKDRAIHTNSFNWGLNSNTTNYENMEYNYWIEFRDGSWPFVKSGVLIWRSEETNPHNDDIPNWDHPKFAANIKSSISTPILVWELNQNHYYDRYGHFDLRVTYLSKDYARLEIKHSTDVYTTATKISELQYNIIMELVGSYFENQSYNFSVVDIVNQSEIFNSTLITNAEGFFRYPIIFTDNITGNIESHPYLFKIHTVNGWVPFFTTTPSIIDGMSNENPKFSINDPTETNTAGDLTNLTSTSGSMKLSLKTAAQVDTDSYKYVIYIDSDNSTTTGFAINDIGADHKIEYTDAGARLYNFNASWTPVDTPYLNAAHNGTNIEILTSTEIMNGSDTMKLVAQTIDSGGNVYDTMPDPASSQTYLQFFDVHPMDIRFDRSGYYAGDTVTVNGYGFAPDQIIPIAIKNQTDNVLWEGSVQADPNGLVINALTWIVPDDFEGTAYLYWAGAQMDSFSRALLPMPSYSAEFDLKTPGVVGIDREFNVTVNFENIGDDLTNLTLKLNTSGMTGEPEIIMVGDLVSGENYTHTWNLTSISSGFALLNADMQSDQTIFTTVERGIYIANISAEILIPTDNMNGSLFEFNVSVTNNQQNITYADLKVKTYINDPDTNFAIPNISLIPGQTVNISYSWDMAEVAPGTYEIIAEVKSNDEILESNSRSLNTAICGDLNCDGSVDISDVTDLLYFVGYPGQYTLCNMWAADVNGDGNVDISDVTDLLYFVGYPGQYNLSCRIN